MGLEHAPVDILIVDDRLDGLIALEAILTTPNVNLVRAQSGREALSLLNQYEFAVILLDVQMPEMDGFETAKIMRETDQYKHTPIIFVTAINKDDRHIYRGYEVGAVDYIFKPFEPQILRSKVNFFVDLFLKSRQLTEQNQTIRDSERQTRYLQLAQLEMETLKRYRNLADAVPNMIWKSKVDGTLDYFNRVWTDYTGLSQEQSIGSGWQEAIHPSDLRFFLKAWIESMNSGHPFEIECRVRRYDGSMRWHWIRAVPELSNHDEVISWIGSCADIHDRKLAEKKLIEAQQMAISANVAKTQFLANMSHEIRTPLGAILGFAELMKSVDLSYEERIQYVNTICASGQQLLKIIDEILDISKVEAGFMEVEDIEFDLSNVLRDLEAMLLLKTQSKGISFGLIFKTPLPRLIHSDPTKLQQILTNMLSNAIKFTTKGKVTLEAELVPGNENRLPHLRFSVTDTGVGIDKAQAEKLFQPFVQVDSSTTRKYGGTGLGLALSRKLAQALGGNVFLDESNVGQGSRFIIEVDAKFDPKVEYLKKLDLPQVKENLKGLKFEELRDLEGLNILLVEDATINQILISRFLNLAGANVEIADNGKQGVDKALAKKFDIVLMDIQMPEMDGYEATMMLRSMGFTTPIIALTAHALKEDRERCFKAGCSDHLTKPIDRELLIAQIAKLTGHVAKKPAVKTDGTQLQIP